MARALSIEIDPTELEKLCAMHCTHEEIAAWFGCSFRTIEERRRETSRMYDVKAADGSGTVQMNFHEIMERGYARGRISIRRHQIRILESNSGGAATMAVWLGKQILGQRDNFDVLVDAAPDKPDDSHRDDLRRRILGLAAKLGSGADTQRPN